MKLAPKTRTSLTPERKEHLESILRIGQVIDNETYLTLLKSKHHKPGRSENTWPLNLNDDDDLKDGTWTTYVFLIYPSFVYLYSLFLQTTYNEHSIGVNYCNFVKTADQRTGARGEGVVNPLPAKHHSSVIL